MSRSNNSRKGKRHSRGSNKRHSCCGDGKGCSYCARNFTHSTTKRSLSGQES